MTTLSRWQASILDQAGNVVPGAFIEVRAQLVAGQPLVTLYSDRAGATPIGNPFAADSNGFAFFHAVPGLYRVRAYTGPSGAPTSEQIWQYVEVGGAVVSQTIVTAAGPRAADPGDDVLIIRQTVGAPFTVTVDWSARTRPLTVVDGKGDAATNNITIVPSAGQTQYGIADYHVIIDGNGGSVTLTPLDAGTGAF